MLEVLLTPVDITVTPDFPIMSNPPEADILLIRRDHARWTREQLMRLPDGIRDTRADHILIEFKYTESVNKSVLAQAPDSGEPALIQEVTSWSWNSHLKR